ncbi:DUF11 domain-containing protein, partial [bacterium]|nr:DUF11 domain-containing protein [bacterium]
ALVFSGITIPANESCTVSVLVSSSHPGTNPNSASGVTTDQTTLGNPSAIENLFVFAPPTVSKSFNPTTIVAGASTVLSLTLGNPATNPGTLTTVQVDDTFPSGLALANTTFTFTPSECGTLTQPAGEGSVHFSASSISAGGACRVEINVTSSTAGEITNTTTAPTANGPVAMSGEAASAPLTVTSLLDLSITITVNPTSVKTNGTVSYTLTVTNAGPSAADGAILKDPVVSGISLSAVACDPLTGALGGAVCPAIGNTVSDLQGDRGIIIPTFPSGGSLVFTLTAQITATGGTVNNPATIAAPGGVTESNLNNNSASVDVTIVASQYKLYLPALNRAPDPQVTVNWAIGVGYEDMPVLKSDFD